MYKSYTKEFILKMIEENKIQSARSLAKKYNFDHTNLNYWKKIKLDDYKEYNKNKIENIQDYLKDKKMSYSYILGLYFGDGCINKAKKSFKLRIFMDSQYNELNSYVIDNLRYLFPQSAINRYKQLNQNCEVLSVHNSNLDLLFPHLGKGNKHLRKIELQEWQINVLDPLAFIQGLIHSDGSYYLLQHKYPAYSFTNMSIDLKQFFIEYLQKLNINPSYKDINKKNIYVYGKEALKLRDLIGTKTNIINLCT